MHCRELLPCEFQWRNQVLRWNVLQCIGSVHPHTVHVVYFREVLDWVGDDVWHDLCSMFGWEYLVVGWRHQLYFLYIWDLRCHCRDVRVCHVPLVEHAFL